jgi:hypothetical protein
MREAGSCEEPEKATEKGGMKACFWGSQKREEMRAQKRVRIP